MENNIIIIGGNGFVEKQLLIFFLKIQTLIYLY